jgi:hypothetical protein
MSLLDFASPLLSKRFLTFFGYFSPFESYSRVSFWLEIGIGTEISAIRDIGSLNACAQQRDPEKAPTCVKSRPLSIKHVNLARRSVRPVSDCENNTP